MESGARGLKAEIMRQTIMDEVNQQWILKVLSPSSEPRDSSHTVRGGPSRRYWHVKGRLRIRVCGGCGLASNQKTCQYQQDEHTHSRYLVGTRGMKDCTVQAGGKHAHQIRCIVDQSWHIL